jgi:hypothetical protein
MISNFAKELLERDPKILNGFIINFRTYDDDKA